MNLMTDCLRLFLNKSMFLDGYKNMFLDDCSWVVKTFFSHKLLYRFQSKILNGEFSIKIRELYIHLKHKFKGMLYAL